MFLIRLLGTGLQAFWQQNGILLRIGYGIFIMECHHIREKDVWKFVSEYRDLHNFFI